MYNIQMMDMPVRTKASHVLNSDGTYTIFINSRLNLEQQQEGYIHELEHILRNDIQKEKYADQIELIAHMGV